MLEIKIINYGGEDYQKTLELRDTILRIPINLRLSEDDTKEDHKRIHMAAFLENEMIACLMISEDSPKVFRIRQVAVKPTLQKLGIGSALMSFAEDYAKENGAKEITLHARRVAENFYEKLDYKQTGKEFQERNIPHIKMYKNI